MRQASISYMVPLMLWVGVMAGVCVPRSSAQTATGGRTEARDFGSSLGRLRWDPSRQAAVEVKGEGGAEAGGAGEEEEVVRVETSLAVCADINRRYVIGFQPTDKARDGRRRKVKIEVRGRPDYVVWGRKSYYAPGPEEGAPSR